MYAKSCHPKCTIHSIPTGEYIRTKRACTNQETFRSRIQDLNHRLSNQGCQDKHLEQAATNVHKQSRESLLFNCTKKSWAKTKRTNRDTDTNSTNNHGIVFSMAISTDFPAIRKIFYKYLPILNKDTKLKHIFKTGCKIVPKRGKTLGSLWSPCEFMLPDTKTGFFQPGSFPCGCRRCNTCRFTSKKMKYTSTDKRCFYKIKHFIKCNTT